MRRSTLQCLLFVVSLGMIAPAAFAKVTETDFGKTKEGVEAKVFEVTNKNGMKVRLLSRGATLIGVDVPDRDGKLADVVFGFDDIAGYESKANSYFGCTTGRYANRIAKGKFTLDGKEYKLFTNDCPNHLHGGNGESLDKVRWDGTPCDTDGRPGV